jgi:hypothetical protein
MHNPTVAIILCYVKYPQKVLSVSFIRRLGAIKHFAF